MKNFYYERIDPVSLAVIDLCDYYGDGLYITRINTPKKHRGKGIASKLLKKVIKEATKEGITLFLEIQASDGLTYKELEQWYARRGFKRWKGIYRYKPVKG